MIILKIFIISFILLALAFVGLAVKIIFQKNGKFPHTHIGGNKEMSKRGIYCAQTMDKIEQRKVKIEQLSKYKLSTSTLKIAADFKDSCH